MTVSDKIKTTDSKIEQNKVQYNLDKQTAKILSLPSGNAGKYEFLAGKDFFSENELLGKAAIIEKFEYSPLSTELKKNELALQKINISFLKIK